MSKHPLAQQDAGLPNRKLNNTERSLLGYTNDELKLIDPLQLNLLVAKGIPALAHLNLFSYEQRIIEWANQIKSGLRDAERQFHETPHHWKNHLGFFRLGYLCYFVDEVLGIRYREDQRDLQSVFYTDPNDLFLNGVMDTKRGTCANMAALHVTLGWRLRWPVSLACVGSHLICRYDDGKAIHNIEATKTGDGGFHSHPDEYYLRQHGLPKKAITCGFDLRALTATEMLGVFFGLRARHYENTFKSELAEPDYLLARFLFPRNRQLHYVQMTVSVQYAMELFEPEERGHPVDVAQWLQEVVKMEPWKRTPKSVTEIARADTKNDYVYSESTREK